MEKLPTTVITVISLHSKRKRQFSFILTILPRDCDSGFNYNTALAHTAHNVLVISITYTHVHTSSSDDYGIFARHSYLSPAIKLFFFNFLGETGLVKGRFRFSFRPLRYGMVKAITMCECVERGRLLKRNHVYMLHIINALYFCYGGRF